MFFIHRLIGAAILLLSALTAQASEHMFHEPPDYPKSERNLNVTTRPAAPTVSSPEHFATVSAASVDLQWQPVEGADFYDVQIALDPVFFNGLKADRHHADTHMTFTGLEPNRHYFYRVAAARSANAVGYVKGAFATGSFSTK